MGLRKLHLVLGLLVSLPVLGWSISGFFLAIPPGVVSGQPYQAIEASKISISPGQALSLLGDAKIASLALEQRGGRAVYSAFGSTGSFLIDASTGEISKPPPTPSSTKWLRNAHFYNFAGPWKTAICLLFSALSAASTLTGLLLAWKWFSFTPNRLNERKRAP